MTILFETDIAATEGLRAAAGGDVVVVGGLADLRRQLDHGSHELVVFGPGIDESVALAFAAAQRLEDPFLGVVLVRRRVDSTVLQTAMRAAVREVVKSDDLASLADACDRSRALSAALRGGAAPGSARDEGGRLTTVFAAKGGCGKTTMATNIASILATGGRRVCLVDLDLAFGDVAIALQLFPTRTIADAVGLSRLDETAVRSLVTTHPSGLDTIVAPLEPGAAEAISATLVRDLLQLLKRMYDVVIVDCPPAFSDHVLAAFDLSDHYVLLATLDIPAVKNLKLTLETLELLSYPRERWHVVLNRSDAKVGLSVTDVERTLSAPIASQVPSSRAVPAAINRGVPIGLDQPNHPVSVAIRNFAEATLVPRPPAGDTGRGKARRTFIRKKTVEVAS